MYKFTAHHGDDKTSGKQTTSEKFFDVCVCALAHSSIIVNTFTRFFSACYVHFFVCSFLFCYAAHKINVIASASVRSAHRNSIIFTPFDYACVHSIWKFHSFFKCIDELFSFLRNEKYSKPCIQYNRSKAQCWRRKIFVGFFIFLFQSSTQQYLWLNFNSTANIIVRGDANHDCDIIWTFFAIFQKMRSSIIQFSLKKIKNTQMIQRLFAKEFIF